MNKGDLVNEMVKVTRSKTEAEINPIFSIDVLICGIKLLFCSEY